VVEALWIGLQWLLVSSRIPGTLHRKWLLRLFGARVGSGVTIKPGLRVKFPWRLHVGDHSWLGEDVWIDNLDVVMIGANCCISQGAYLCSGSHDWSSETFDLIVRPIRVHDGVWIAARCIVGPGVEIGAGAVLALGSVAGQRLEPWTVYRGNPAVPVRPRKLRSNNSP
jgi:putative colanic acid biosynthesis acetyltransferase WcaF